MGTVQNPHIHGADSSSLVGTDHVGETIIETGSPISLLELADVNEDIRPFGLWRDKAESPGVVPFCKPSLLLHQITARQKTAMSRTHGGCGGCAEYKREAHQKHNFVAMTLTPQPQPHRRPCKMNPSASPRP